MKYKTYLMEDALEYIIDYRGKTPKKSDNGIVTLSAKSVRDGYIDYKQAYYISKEEYDRFMVRGFPQIGDVLLTTEAPLGITARLDRSDIALAQRLLTLHGKEGVLDTGFLYYYLKSPVGQAKLMAKQTGTTVTGIKQAEFRKIEIDLPDIEIQRKAASILEVIDKRITVNKHINDNLLKQARTVFQSWFVDFDPFNEPMIISPAGYEVPQSLRMIQIQELPHLLETGKRPKGGAVSEGIPSVGAENVKTLGSFDASSAKYIPYDFAASMKKGKIEGYELLLYKDGGKPGTFTPHFSMFGEGFPYDKFYINEHVFKLDFYDRGFNEFAYFYMHTDYPYHWLASNGGKAAIPGINQQDVNSIWIYHPDHPKVQEFCHWVQPLFVDVFSNCAQNMKLAKLRDLLLPRLMSGEIDVSNITI